MLIETQGYRNLWRSFGGWGLAFYMVFMAAVFPACSVNAAEDEFSPIPDPDLVRELKENVLTPVATARLDGKTIESIDIQGNVSITENQVMTKIRTRPGDTFITSSVEEDARRIAELGGVVTSYYSASENEAGNIDLTYVVVEQNLIRSISFQGNKKIKDSALVTETGLAVGNYLDLFRVRNAAQDMLALYHKKGYPFAEVTFDQSQADLGRVVYNIEEGPRTKLAKISFRGNDSLKSGDLMKGIKSKTRKWVLWPGYYKEETVSEDVDKLRVIYQNRGFLDSTVTSEVEFNENRTEAYLTYIIDEGPVYTTNDIIINGNSFFTDQPIIGSFKLEEGEFYSTQKAEFDRKKMLDKYLEEGFINAEVEHIRTFPGEGQVNAVFNIIPGERFRIGRIEITGNQNTHDKVIRRVLDEEEFTPGNWFNAHLARGDGEGELERDIRQTVFTKSAFIEPVGDDPNVRDVVVSVVEGQTGSVMFGAGIASDNGLIGQLVFDQRNFDIESWPKKTSDIFTGKAFRGAGQRLRIALEPGTEVSRYSVSFTEPYLYDRPVALNVGGSSWERRREAYDEERMKLFLALEKRYRDDWRHGIGVRLENVDVKDVDFDAPVEIQNVRGDNAVYGLRFFIGKDTTDSRFLPTKGYNFDAGYEQVAGDETFGIVDFTQRWYKTLHEDFGGLKTVLETKIHAAGIVGDAQPFEKFYAGGIGSLRGFDYRGVSTRGVSTANPNVKKDPIGSDWIFLANAEVAVPMGNETFSWLFFVDSGAIDTGGYRAAVGTGLQLLIPQWFGPVPMRFELATPLMKDDADETRVFSFSVGALF